MSTQQLWTLHLVFICKVLIYQRCNMLPSEIIQLLANTIQTPHLYLSQIFTFKSIALLSSRNFLECTILAFTWGAVHCNFPEIILLENGKSVLELLFENSRKCNAVYSSMRYLWIIPNIYLPYACLKSIFKILNPMKSNTILNPFS